MAAGLALALVPALAAAQTEKSASPAQALDARSPSGLPYALSIGLGPSFESGTAFKMRFEGSMALKPLFPNSEFELALPVSLTFWGESGSLGFNATYDASYTRFEIVPTARISTPVANGLALYGDAGLGFQFYSGSVTTHAPPATPYFTVSTSGAGGIFKLAIGGHYALAPSWRLFIEPVGLNLYFGDGSGFVYTIMLGGQYRFRG